MNRLVCNSCDNDYSMDEPVWRCRCGGLLDIEFKPRFPLRKIKSRPETLWRYREAIPITHDENIVSFQEGFTPLIEIPFGSRSAYIKQDHLFPSGSFKDRGATVMIGKVKELGIKRVVEDSSGNAGASVAAYCARAGINCEIFVPQSTSAGKIAQIQMYGAKLKKIPGTRDDTAAAVLDAARRYYYASHSWNPFFFHGSKTFAYEVCEQLGWRAPDAVVLPAGNGTLLIGAYIGFTELLNAGITKKIPKIVGVQPAHCAPLYQAFRHKSKTVPAFASKPTWAEGIAATQPVRGPQMLDIIEKTQGCFLAVSEASILKATRDTAKKGFFIEPTTASIIAGLIQYMKTSESETIVSVFTGTGLKSTDKILTMMKP